MNLEKIVCFLLLASIGLGCRSNQPEPYLIRIGHVANDDHTWHQAFLFLAEIVHQRTDGRLEVQVYPGEQLGKEQELIRSIRAGVVDITVTGGTLENWSKVAGFSDMPYLIHDSEHLKSINESKIGEKISARILAETGLRPIAIFERGPRNLTSNRPVRHPDDLQGLTIRVPNVPSYVTAWQALGAKPTPMAFSEVFTGLQQGTVEAQENPIAMIASASFQEVQKYLNLTEHVVSWGYVVMGEQQLQALPDDLRQIFLEAVQEMQDYEHQLFLAKEKELAEFLQSEGMQFIEVDKNAFQEIAEKAVYESLPPDLQQIFLQIKQLDQPQAKPGNGAAL